jgi:hypothetical protein
LVATNIKINFVSYILDDNSVPAKIVGLLKCQTNGGLPEKLVLARITISDAIRP